MGTTAIIGAQYGSEGKGVIAAKLADQFDVAVRTGGPNAGHSLRYEGRTYKMRSVPCAWINPECALVIGAGAVVKKDLLIREIESLPFYREIYLDPKAVIITDQMEHDEQRLIAKIGSTAEGVGEARKARIRRDVNEGIQAGDYAWPSQVLVTDTVSYLAARLRQGHRVMLEGTQGSGLSLIHGPWPMVTSGDTNVAGFLSEAGIAPANLDHTLLVARSYPIRVGGNSGSLHHELHWDDIPGKPEPEITTVTFRQRRIGEWDIDLVLRAVDLNAPCGIALTFADYIDPSIAGVTTMADLAQSPAVRRFVDLVEHETDTPVVMVSTGGPEWSVVQTGVCSHGVPMLLSVAA